MQKESSRLARYQAIDSTGTTYMYYDTSTCRDLQYKVPRQPIKQEKETEENRQFQSKRRIPIAAIVLVLVPVCTITAVIARSCCSLLPWAGPDYDIPGSLVPIFSPAGHASNALPEPLQLPRCPACHPITLSTTYIGDTVK